MTQAQLIDTMALCGFINTSSEQRRVECRYHVWVAKEAL